MRTFSVCCLAMAMLLQMGCATFSSRSKLTSHRKMKPDPQAATNFVKARDLERQGKFERARELYEQIVEKDPENPEYLHRLAVICTRLQRYGEADDFFDRAVKLAPKDPSIVADMGYSHYLRGDLDQAERLLRDAVRQKPSDKRAVSNLALVVGVRGNVDESLSLLMQIDEKPTALSNLAYIHTQRGEYDLAEKRFKEALAIDAKHKDATKGLAEVSKLRPQQDVSVAESKSIEHSAFKPFNDEFSDESAPVIRQASADIDPEKRSVLTANFVEEASASTEPGLLDASEKPATEPTSPKVTTAKFDVENEFEDDVRSEKPVAAPRDVSALDDDWDADVPLKPRSANGASSSSKLSREPFDFDSDPDETPSVDKSAASVSTPTREQLKFVPAKSRTKVPTANPASDLNDPF